MGGETPVGPVALSIIKDGNSYKILYRTKQVIWMKRNILNYTSDNWWYWIVTIFPFLNGNIF